MKRVTAVWLRCSMCTSVLDLHRYISESQRDVSMSGGVTARARDFASARLSMLRNWRSCAACCFRNVSVAEMTLRGQPNHSRHLTRRNTCSLHTHGTYPRAMFSTRVLPSGVSTGLNSSVLPTERNVAVPSVSARPFRRYASLDGMVGLRFPPSACIAQHHGPLAPPCTCGSTAWGRTVSEPNVAVKKRG